MEYPCSVMVASERVMEELSQGREYADQLRATLLDDESSSSLLLSANASCLVEKILHSFTHSLSILQTKPPLKSEDSDHSFKTPAPKDRRGCYKRRKTLEISIKETTSLFEDGHAWRKYGQKVILNAKHPRNYFRCTHKFDQGCQATKQVQKIQEDPFPLFKTTYLGHHTCLFKSPNQIIMDTNHHHNHDDPNSTILSFESLGNGSSMIKQECSSNSSSIKSEASSSSSIVLDNDQLRCSTVIASNLNAFSSSASDYAGDMYSCATTASTNYEMDRMIFDEFLEIYGRN